jgi:hypothetical protein
MVTLKPNVETLNNQDYITQEQASITPKTDTLNSQLLAKVLKNRPASTLGLTSSKENSKPPESSNRPTTPQQPPVPRSSSPAQIPKQPI